MKTKLGLLATSALAALVLVGCGDDGGSSSAPSNADQVVASFEDLTQCTAKREGATAYVKDEKKEYACLSGNWVPTDDAVSSVAGSSAGVSSAGVSESGRSSAASDGQWQNASGLEYVRSAKTCAHNAELVVGSATDANRYVCDADTFRVATDSEKGADRGCTSYNLNEERLFAGNATCSQSGIWLASTNTVPGTMTYGGQTYKTIGIGTQMWMAENLNYEYKVDGSTYGNWCYNNSADSCAKYGRLYTWAAAMDTATTGCGYRTTCAASSGKVRGICPTGWHLPSDAEWSTLITAVGGKSTAGTMLKSTTGWRNDNNGTDAYGFSALPSGDVDYGEYFGNAGDRAHFWSSSELNQLGAYYMYLGGYNQAHAYRDVEYGKVGGLAVRCVKD